jgi:DNA-directed RNA polymerase specialized sigma24 family protein
MGTLLWALIGLVMSGELQKQAMGLHRRLLSGDPRAPSEIFTLFENQLSAVVRTNVPRLTDPGDVNIAIADTLLNYFRNPSAYDLGKSSLLTWLCNQARYTALSMLRAHGRRARKIESFGQAVRIGLVGRDNIWDGESDFLDAIEVSQIMGQYGDEIVKDDGDSEVFLLMAAGCKDEAMFGEVLGLSSVSTDARDEIRRRRDGIRKRLERLRKKLESRPSAIRPNG